MNPTGLVEKGKESIRVLLMGESSIAGVGVRTHVEGIAGSLAKTMAAKYNYSVDWEVIAQSGITAAKAAQNLVPKIPLREFDLIVVGMGANNTFNFHSPYRWKSEVTHLIDRLIQAQPNCPIVFLNMPPVHQLPALPKVFQFLMGTLNSSFHTILKDLTKKYEQVHFSDEKISFQKWLRHAPPNSKIKDFFSDGVHPSRLTYKIWGQEMFKYLQSKGLIKKRENQQ